MSLLGLGYDSITSIVNRIPVFDPALVLELCVLLAVCSALYYYSSEFVYNITQSHCMTRAEVDGIDPAYAYLMRRMTVHQVTLSSRTVKATAALRKTKEDYQDRAPGPATHRLSSLPNRQLPSPSRHRAHPVPTLGPPHLPPRRHAGTFFVFQRATIPPLPSQRAPIDFIGTHRSITLS
ncbi:hypothetical protein MMC34_003123 [Xylographa carneopallida]|nr:hypothetical protein [Xylographa carneopallida]